MLDTETKRRIDNARDILVGKVSDPKSQVEQITIALIYKFMDDMDAESEELGGKRKFFAGGFQRYGWAKLMRSGLGGHEMLNLYSEAIAKMPENPGVPLLFRNIFKNAYLPYRDPETLKSFLKIIDDFEYDHSERLGDAFEYLLSALGSQGDLGSLRTPRHIIDFIVEIINPQKGETILDPACGTAGFLISAYKYIKRANTDKDGNDKLTPDQRRKLAANIKGYDISPDMVRLSLVNLYLHGFADPHIAEYDTLTSDEKWNEFADVILANPPFMSPKGGIRPHSRFSFQSKRSEVLFVDYIAEHLNPNGRAGIIVPEGIIFQSQKAHTELRKMLVKSSLVAVISLPAGVFNPYSGVRTSILILDKALAKQTNTVAFFKVENDGFDLGAQRRPIYKNDLPRIKEELLTYFRSANNARIVADSPSMSGLFIAKEKVAASDGYNLSGGHYRNKSVLSSHYPSVQLGEVAEVIAGQSPPGTSYNDTGVGTPFFQGKIEFGRMFIGKPTKWTDAPQRFAAAQDILMSVRAPVGPVNLATQKICIGRGLAAIRPMKNKLHHLYAYHVLHRMEAEITGSSGAVFASISKRDIQKIKFPLPPLEIQQEIVSEIDGYQKIIDGARMVLDNYRPHIPTNSAWPMVKLGNERVFSVQSGGTPKSTTKAYWNGDIAWITLEDLPSSNLITEITSTARAITKIGLQKSAAKVLPINSVVVSSRATIGRIGITRVPLATNQGFKNIVIKDSTQAVPEYVALALTKIVPAMQAQASGSTYKEITKSRFCQLEVPLPPVEVQKNIVAELDDERSLVHANRELIERMEQKIQTTIARVWGEGKDMKLAGAARTEEEL